MLIAAAGMAWLTRIGVHTSYASTVLGPHAGDRGRHRPVDALRDEHRDLRRPPSDAGVASATLNIGQQIGGSIGTALLNTIATSAAASYIDRPDRLNPAVLRTLARRGRLFQAAAARCTGTPPRSGGRPAIFAAGGMVCGALFRWGPLSKQAAAAEGVPAGQRAAGPSVPA